MNDAKPLWLRSPRDIDDDEYTSFYRLFSKDSADPLAKIHFTAEGEVTFKAILFVPAVSVELPVCVHIKTCQLFLCIGSWFIVY